MDLIKIRICEFLDFQETGRSTNNFTGNLVFPPTKYRLPVDSNAAENSGRESALHVENVKFFFKIVVVLRTLFKE